MKNETNENYGQLERNFHHDEDGPIDRNKETAIEELFDNDKYQNLEDDLQNKEETLIDINHETNDYNRNENIPNEERVIDEDGLTTNDEEEDDDDFNQNDLDDIIEKDGDLDDDNEDEDYKSSEDLEEADEYFPDTHTRE